MRNNQPFERRAVCHPRLCLGCVLGDWTTGSSRERTCAASPSRPRACAPFRCRPRNRSAQAVVRSAKGRRTLRVRTLPQLEVQLADLLRHAPCANGRVRERCLERVRARAWRVRPCCPARNSRASQCRRRRHSRGRWLGNGDDGGGGRRSVVGGSFGVPLRSARRQPLPLQRRDNARRVGPIGPSRNRRFVASRGQQSSPVPAQSTTDLESQAVVLRCGSSGPSPGVDVAAVRAQSRGKCGSGVGPIPVQMWHAPIGTSSASSSTRSRGARGPYHPGRRADRHGRHRRSRRAWPKRPARGAAIATTSSPLAELEAQLRLD
jgi:hypothetical protein